MPRQPALKTVPRVFYKADAQLVAPQLLNKILRMDDGRAGRIVEVEAYRGAEDPAAHSFRGPTARTATMFGPNGHLYVYFSYGIHWCCNITCGLPGQAVLIRAIEPYAGVELIRAARPSIQRERDLGSGPGRLTQALGITGSHDGADLVKGDRGVRLMSDGREPPAVAVATARIGISKAMDLPLRWYVPGSAHVSGIRRLRSPGVDLE